MSRVSVVVPVYNVEDYLDECLASITGQTLRDIEIVCVDDGSTDSSADILRGWAAKDDRIRVVSKPNGGLSSARNAGIQSASSPVLCFVDSDDTIVPTCCEEIARRFDEDSYDVFTYGANIVPPEAAYPWLEDVLSPGDAVYDGFDPDILFKEKSRPFAWRTACRTAFLRDEGLRFDETVRFGEDQVFHFAVYPRSRKTVFSSHKLYNYRASRVGSLMTTVKNDPVYKMGEHVKILTVICREWKASGSAPLCPAQFVAFALDFALYGALKFSNEDYGRIAQGVEDALHMCWSSQELTSLELPKYTGQMLEEACLSRIESPLARKRLALSYYAQQYGKRAALARLLGR